MIQKLLPSGATVAPVILASDKTNLSRFSGDKVAWPVYLTIGNIEKATRRKPSSRATVLIGYLPTSKLECFSQKSRRQAEQYRLFHTCMRALLQPLVEAGMEGVEMVCADGKVRRVYPIVAAYVGDHPEQCLVTCCQENRCPKCPVDPDKRGTPGSWTKLKEHSKIAEILHERSNGQNKVEFESLGLRPVLPFWSDLPHSDIFSSITPDLLHQLHKGVFKDHLVQWSTACADDGKDEFDRRYRAMTPHRDLRHFKKGISFVSQWTGTEYKNMEKVFLGVVAGTADTDVTKAVRAILDFIYYAHFELHTDTSLAMMRSAWLEFHRAKRVFLRQGVREHFNIPKLHSMEHYLDSIREFGAADGYSTESPERHHIDLAKLAYDASNKQSSYTVQMTTWLNRQDAILRFDTYLRWLGAIQESEGPESGEASKQPQDSGELGTAEKDAEESAPVDSEYQRRAPTQ